MAKRPESPPPEPRADETDETAARSAVVTIVCPSCGGSVRGAEPGERSTCTYCGTELHVPTIEARAPEPEPSATRADEPEPAPTRRRPADGKLSPFILGVAALLLIAIAWSSASKPSRTHADTPEMPGAREGAGTRVPNPGSDDVLAHADCTVGCYEPCMEIKDPDALMRCMGACDDKCKSVGRGTRAQCVTRCSERCAAAPAASRAACESGCQAGCPAE